MAKQDRPKKEKKPTFNAPFQGLSRLRAEEPKKVSPPKPSAPKPAAVSSSERELFAQAMAGVEPLKDSHGFAPLPQPREARVTSDDAEALARLSELVSGDGPFDIADTDEFIEGAANGVDRRVLLALKRGEYAVQGHVDLHGMTRPDAKEAVDRFFTASQRAGKRCVLIVHGRGLNSKDQIPVLKRQLHVWLQRGRFARMVLAFATARPHDGGSGALYVLLRR